MIEYTQLCGKRAYRKARNIGIPFKEAAVSTSCTDMYLRNWICWLEPTIVQKFCWIVVFGITAISQKQTDSPSFSNLHHQYQRSKDSSTSPCTQSIFQSPGIPSTERITK